MVVKEKIWKDILNPNSQEDFPVDSYFLDLSWSIQLVAELFSYFCFWRIHMRQRWQSRSKWRPFKAVKRAITDNRQHVAREMNFFYFGVENSWIINMSNPCGWFAISILRSKYSEDIHHPLLFVRIRREKISKHSFWEVYLCTYICVYMCIYIPM